MNILKQSTAATIKLGPFVDDTDGKTAETALTIGQADIRLSKNGGDIAQSHNTAGATHDELGYYDIPLDTTDTGTLGRLRVLVSKAGALPVWQDFVVVTANVYDSMFSTDKLDVAVVEMATDVLTAAAVKADAVTKIQNGLATPTNITAGTITTVTNLTNLPTMPTDWVTAAGLKADAVTEIQSGLATAAALDAVDNFIDTEVAAILAAVDTEVAAIKAKTDNLPASPAAVGSAMTLTAAYDKAKDDVLTPLAVVDSIVDGLKTTLDNIHDTDLPAVKTETAAIKAKTDLIPASPAEAGEYTAAIAAVKSVADDILVDTGTTLDTLIKDIPTNAELATALGTADDAVLAAVAAAKVVIDDIHDTDLPAVKAETALIVEDTGTTIPATLATIAGYTDGIAGDVWSHATRTLTVPAVAMSDPEDGTTLTLYKDADINIEFTGLTIPTGAKKVVFTIKDNLDDADTAAALQATYQLTAVPAETHTLNYINSATPPTLTNPVTFTVTTDSVEFDMTAAAAYYLPRYERGYLKWDLKLITATTVQILQQGLVQILGTSTRTVA